MDEWCSKGYKIILTTARRESLRARTESELARLGIPYDVLVTGIGNGHRVVINDRRLNGDKTAFAINIGRDHGLEGIDL